MKTLLCCISLLLLFVSVSVTQANELYGVTSPRTGFEIIIEPPEAVLYKIDPDSGNATEIGPTGFSACFGLDFHPITNELYGICRRFEERNGREESVSDRLVEGPEEIFVKINMNTGQATEIGPLMIEDANPFTMLIDMSFDSSGTLYVYVVNVGDDMDQMRTLDEVDNKFIFSETDRLGVVNTETGKYTEIGETGFSDLFSGIAFSSVNDLYQAGAQKINLFSILNQQTGEASPKVPLMLPFEILEKQNFVTSMDLRSSTNRLFAVIVSDSENGAGAASLTRNGIENATRLTMINPATGDVTLIGLTVDDLSAIAFLNRGRTEIPTLSEWGLISLSAVLMLLAVFYLRRKAHV